MSSTPYQFISRGNLFITPVGRSINEVPYPRESSTKPREFSLWVHGNVEEPEFQLDKLRMPPSMYQEVRKDLSRYSSVPVSRSAFRRSQHAYVGVIDSNGKPYYFALDSRGFSCREAPINDDRVWKTFDSLAGQEQMMAIQQRRHRADEEMEEVDRELSQPLLVLAKGLRSDQEKEHAKLFKPFAKAKRKGACSKTPGGCGCHTCEVKKALPKKDKSAAPAKKMPATSKASKKQMGAGGKTRYTYPNEKKGGAPKLPQPTPVTAAPPQESKRRIDHVELINQLGISKLTLSKVATKLGRKGFSWYMRSHLKRFAAKHHLGHDYWDAIYGTLVQNSIQNEEKAG